MGYNSMAYSKYRCAREDFRRGMGTFEMIRAATAGSGGGLSSAHDRYREALRLKNDMKMFMKYTDDNYYHVVYLDRFDGTFVNYCDYMYRYAGQMNRVWEDVRRIVFR